jgi:hypothetical protein
MLCSAVYLPSNHTTRQQIYLKVLAENGTKVLKVVTARSMLLPPRQPSQVRYIYDSHYRFA